MKRLLWAPLLTGSVLVMPVSAQDDSQPPPSAFDRQIAETKSYIMSDPERALSEAREAAELGAKLDPGNRALAIATSRWLEGEALTRMNRADDAAPIIESALETVSVKAPKSKIHGDLLKSNAVIATNEGRVEQALQMLHRSFAIYDGLDDKRSQAIVLHLIGSIYYEARDYERVLSYYDQAHTLYPDDLALSLSAHNNRGNAFSDTRRYNAAEKQFEMALAAAREMQSPLLQVRILTNLSSSQMMQGKYRQADRTALDGLRIANGEAGEWQPYLWGVRAQIALARGQISQARSFIERTFSGVDLENSDMSYRDYHATATEIYEKQGDFRQALSHLAAYKRLDDSGRELAASTNAALVSAEFDEANRNIRISRLEADETQRKMELSQSASMTNYLLVALGAAITVIGMLFFSITHFRRTRREITEANAQLYHTSTHDLLTGLPNRAHFRTILSRMLEESTFHGTQCGVMIVDLDRFKAVNDTLGHAVGDQLLSQVAERMIDVAGEYAYPARLGGDEFALVVPDIGTENQLAHIADSLIEELSRPYLINEVTASIGATIGGASGPEDGDTIERLTRAADLALYEGKKAGRGRYVRYRKIMQLQADERHELERDLRDAMENGDLSIVYQSIVDAHSEQVVCYEALLRWNHPDRGEISPDIFIPIAEEARLIHTIGSWVLSTACAEAVNWPDHIRVAVNVSSLQVEGGSLSGHIVRALATSGLSPDRLEIEVTESVFLNTEDHADNALEGLHKLGVNLVLDDFGTGYSSLGYLRRARFSTIKIDRSFVRSVKEGSEDGTVIIRAIVSMAQELGMQTTAEGIETNSDMVVMRDLGCSQLQGFYFSRPETMIQTQAETQRLRA